MLKSPEEIAEEKLRGKLTKRFHKACAEYGLIEDGDHILIGLSGGKDSLLLTELLGKRARIYKPHFKVSALHVRVKERAYTSDMSYLEEFCKEAGIPLMVRDVSIDNAQERFIAENETIAWPEKIGSDKHIINKMLNGFKILVFAESRNFTYSVDTYSLSGFKKSYNKILELCK